MVVSKFGGSSLKDAASIRRCADLARERGSGLVVVSALGDTTDRLVELGRRAVEGACGGDWEALKNRHVEIGLELGATEGLEELFLEGETLLRGVRLLRDCNAKTLDRLLSLGERLSSRLMAGALGARHVDVREVMRTDGRFSKAAPDLGKVFELVESRLKPLLDGVCVTQGFVGATEEGWTTTLGRGGSDYSAAVLAAALKASVLEVWTDVAGVATADPGLFAEARPIAEMTFQEASELAVFGARVLHPRTLPPVARAGIPVFVGSSYKKAPGTWIKKDCREGPLVRAVTLRGGQSMLTLKNPDMLNTWGFLGRVFEIFARHKVSVDAITTSEICVGMTLDESSLGNPLVGDLEREARVAREDGLAMVCLIGNRINHTPGLAQRVFNGLGRGSPINVRMICLGASRHNFCLVVKEALAQETLRRLHREFIG